MYVNPAHPNPPQQPAPPQDDGEQLACIPRGDGREQFRVSLKEYQGHPYISLRLWSRDNRGGMWPVSGKGISVRLGEAAQVADALRQALELTEGPRRQPRAETPRDDRPGYVDRRRSQREDWRQATLPGPGQGGPGFEEF